MGFPASPSDGDIYQNANGQSWQYNTSTNKWKAYTTHNLEIVNDLDPKLGNDLDCQDHSIAASKIVFSKPSTSPEFRGIIEEGQVTSLSVNYADPIYLDSDGYWKLANAATGTQKFAHGLSLTSTTGTGVENTGMGENQNHLLRLLRQ